jgi:acetyl esterase/lipase/glycerophosphoryl diester phosphodiesterase
LLILPIVGFCWGAAADEPNAALRPSTPADSTPPQSAATSTGKPLLRAAAAGVRQIVAHRGASADRPENTSASTLRAIQVGATAVEVDVRTTRDGRLVLSHDATVERMTDGQGTIADLTFDEIRKLSAGRKFDEKYAEERVPSLDEVAAVCRGRIDVLLDLKETGPEYARRVVDCIRKHGDPVRTIVGVRSVEQAGEFRKLLPEARQIGLIGKPDEIEAYAAAGVETIRIWPKWLADPKLADANLVERVRKAGVGLHLNGTDGTSEEIAELLSHRPVSLSSDDPERTVASLAALAGEPVSLRNLEFARPAGRPLYLDLYLPTIQESGRLPTVVWIHGGGWSKGSRKPCPAAWLAEHGFAVASIDYRLTDIAKWPAQIDDCRAAIRWLRENAAAYGLNPDRFGAWGGSAGGHLAALAGTLDAPPDEKPTGGRTSSRVQAVCDWYGPTDLLTMPPNVLSAGKTVEDLAKSNGAKLLGGIVRDRPDLAKAASAWYQATADDPPFLIVHGDADPQVPLEQSRKLDEKLRSVGGSSVLVVLRGAGHGGPAFQTPELRQTITDFFRKHLRGEAGN